MTPGAMPPGPLELWGGIECTVNRVGDRWFDQIAWSGHDDRPDDLERFAALGIKAIRYPVLWERLAPRSLDDIDWRWTDERLPRLRDLGIRVIAGLVHHGSGPRYTSLLDAGFPDKLAAFAAAVARRYPWIDDFTPVNEPLTTARFSALYGHWYPHARSRHDFLRALVHQVRGTVLAMRAIRGQTPHARLVQTEDCGRTYGTRVVQPQVLHEGHRRWLTWDLLAGRVNARHPLRGFLERCGFTAADEAFFLDNRCPPDLLGLNYYLTSDRYLDHRLDRYPPDTHGGNEYFAYADLEAVRARPEGIAGHEAHLTAAWKRYGIPLAITEVHLGCTRDEQMRWMAESWRAAARARSAGADVRAVTAWALLGSWNWDSLVTEDAARYEPGIYDVRGPYPRPTALAPLVRRLAAGDAPDHPVLDGPPWWQRAERMTYVAGRQTPADASRARPVLIIGSTGTLGRAFQRLCTVRGLASHLVGRQEVDITDPAGVDAIVRRTRPWAVINAAGYVRVDEAERDADACWRANATGPINLAASCRRRGLPLVTFSTDLVFDGTLARPYVEDDPPSPLNVYGTSKAEAERRVLDLLPEALVIRTSAFFGPWDDYNFLACLWRALDAGATFAAPSDVVVSPTYVPDLVNATLDLLIDGEQGLWHLANEGAVTWFDFACGAARRRGSDTALIVPATAASVWAPARRPAFTALSSRRGRLLRSLDAALDAYVEEVRLARLVSGVEGTAS